MPYKASASCGVKSNHNQIVYIIGGLGDKKGNRFLTTILAYDIQNSSFREILGKMNQGRRHCSCQVYGQRILAAGGEFNYKPISSAEVYDTILGVWAPIKNSPKDRSWFLDYGKDLFAMDSETSVLAIYDDESENWLETLRYPNSSYVTKMFIHASSNIMMPMCKIEIQ